MPQLNHQQLSKEFQPSFYLKKTSAAKNSEITFIDLFAGIGGFHVALKNLKAKCVFAAEIDKEARKTYELNHYKHSSKMFDSKNFVHDITKINPHEIPDFDLLCAGFPCQPFSQAGFKKGFEEARGTLFFNIANIIKTKKPQAFFLENVRHLLNHQNGETFATIKKILEQDLGYKFYYKIVKASDFNLPQHRARLFMIGFKDQNIDLIWFFRVNPTRLVSLNGPNIQTSRFNRHVGSSLSGYTTNELHFATCLSSRRKPKRTQHISV